MASIKLYFQRFWYGLWHERVVDVKLPFEEGLDDSKCLIGKSLTEAEHLLGIRLIGRDGVSGDNINVSLINGIGQICIQDDDPRRINVSMVDGLIDEVFFQG